MVLNPVKCLLQEQANIETFICGICGSFDYLWTTKEKLVPAIYSLHNTWDMEHVVARKENCCCCHTGPLPNRTVNVKP